MGKSPVAMFAPAGAPTESTTHPGSLERRQARIRRTCLVFAAAAPARDEAATLHVGAPATANTADVPGVRCRRPRARRSRDASCRSAGHREYSGRACCSLPPPRARRSRDASSRSAGRRENGGGAAAGRVPSVMFAPAGAPTETAAHPGPLQERRQPRKRRTAGAPAGAKTAGRPCRSASRRESGGRT